MLLNVEVRKNIEERYRIINTENLVPNNHKNHISDEVMVKYNKLRFS